MSQLFHILDWILFVLAVVPAGYFAVFAAAALFKRKSDESASPVSCRIVTLIPAYRCDSVIVKSVEAALNQNCKGIVDNRVVVIADGLSDDTCSIVESLGAEVLKVSFDNSSKAKSLNYAMDSLGSDAADFVTILDADNIVGPDYLTGLSSGFAAGYKALQAHRTARNRNTPTAVLDAASEEINNTIFRLGHNFLGLSSALIGSGMAFDYKWFRDHISECTTAGEDKELELLLLKENVFVKYLDDVVVLDEKTSAVESYHGQRRRWISAQFYSLESALPYMPKAISSVNVSYLDKVLQWSFLPRMVILAMVPVMAVLCLIFSAQASLKWFALALLLAIVLYIALPDSQRDSKLLKALSNAPALSVSALVNMFHLRGNKDVFIHTEHNVSENE